MPTIAEGPYKGMKAELLAYTLGVPGRMNPANILEVEINFISMWIRDDIKNHSSLKDKENILLEYYSFISPKQVDFTKNFLKDLSKEEKKQFFDEVVENGIFIHQGPFTDNISINDLNRIYEHYIPKLGIKPFKFKGWLQPMVMGEMYIMRLKHQSSNKTSIRSTGFTNLKNLPAKDKDFKDGKALYSHTPIKLGRLFIAEDKLF